MTKIASITITSKRHKIIGEALDSVKDQVDCMKAMGYPEDKIQESLSVVEAIKGGKGNESEVDIKS